MTTFVEHKGCAAFTTVGSIEVPIRGLMGPYTDHVEAADAIAKMTNHEPREGEWIIWEIDLPATAAAAA